MHSCITIKWRVTWSGHLCELANYNQRTAYKAEYWIPELDSWIPLEKMVAVLECCKVCTVNIHIGKDRTPYANLSGPMESIQGWRLLFPVMLHYQWRDVVSALQAGVRMTVHGVVIWILHQTKSLRCSLQWVKRFALTFGIGKGQSFRISWNPDK